MNSPSALTSLPVPAPTLGAALRSRFARAGWALWHGLEAHGRARALRELYAAADRRQDSDPEAARQLRDAIRFLASGPTQV